MKRLLTALALLCLTSGLRAEDTKISAGNLNFTLPASGWTSVPTSSPMRAATLQITVEGAEKPLEAIFYYFGAGQGGDTQANINRWLGQFESPPESKTEELDANGTKVSLVTATGTYMDGAMFGPKTAKADYTLLGAIIPGPDAPVFIKLTGPKDAVAKITEDFKKLSTSPFAK
ncbi:hypothetical protein SAMN02745166_01406 [Prosthecobacter debontii]|uniref:Uncharacterized protein n=1 Tax=Prosthecobacter debontii TaxID=48467 RepID=A0A1T4XGS0_9BACT|nr:hypothetical protein [Prosthecobacter debontii]SKA88358.1 hypothetical protein SAMN02745166_01406 [Prosthecobacter debontii]